MSAHASPATLSRSAVLAGLSGALLVAATVGLWAFYGTAVFFEVIRAGWMACF